jgi:hypothetical protein
MTFCLIFLIIFKIGIAKIYFNYYFLLVRGVIIKNCIKTKSESVFLFIQNYVTNLYFSVSVAGVVAPSITIDLVKYITSNLQVLMFGISISIFIVLVFNFYREISNSFKNQKKGQTYAIVSKFTSGGGLNDSNSENKKCLFSNCKNGGVITPACGQDCLNQSRVKKI